MRNAAALSEKLLSLCAFPTEASSKPRSSHSHPSSLPRRSSFNSCMKYRTGHSSSQIGMGSHLLCLGACRIINSIRKILRQYIKKRQWRLPAGRQATLRKPLSEYPLSQNARPTSNLGSRASARDCEEVGESSAGGSAKTFLRKRVERTVLASPTFPGGQASEYHRLLLV